MNESRKIVETLMEQLNSIGDNPEIVAALRDVLVLSEKPTMSELALTIANDIANQFSKGFCDFRMVTDFAKIVDRHLEKTSKKVSDEDCQYIPVGDVIDLTYSDIPKIIWEGPSPKIGDKVYIRKLS